MNIYEGNISVKAAILSPYRDVVKVIVANNKKDRDTNFIIRKAKEANIEVSYLDRSEIDHIASGNTHGGVIAYVGDRTYQNIKDIPSPHAFIAFIEGIEDPYNFGYIIRSLYAAGCDTIITSERNWSNAAATLAKASAGASEYIKHVVSNDTKEILKYLKKENIKIVCAMRDDSAIEMYEYDFNTSLCICIGGEKRGLSKEVLHMSDQNVYIPYNSSFKNALNATGATIILAYEVVRQRKKIL